jgi:TRAP transporter TAXI family solute receptor
MTRRDVLTGAACAAALPAAFPASAAAGDLIGVATSSPGSVLHSAASALAVVANEKGGLPMTVQAFASPNVYLPAVGAGEIAFGVSNAGDLRLAALGEQHFAGRPLPGLRAAAVMFPMPMALYVRADSPARTIGDLRGLRTAAGFAGQKTLRPLFDALLAAGGLTTDDIDLVRAPDVVSGANAFIEGKADAFFFALGAAKVREADAAVDGGLRALNIADPDAALPLIKARWPAGYVLEATPGPASPGVLEPIWTLTHDSVVVAGASTPEEVVHALVRVLHDEKEALRASFAAFARLDPDRMLVDVPDVAWHPGALGYYREIGREQPEG